MSFGKRGMILKKKVCIQKNRMGEETRNKL